ncbi:MAG: TonB-dependent receptor [Gammaproteobacteria bacterium AqS3]|nr:TonB-dependent receptor [Gammaproteobacteria bacterium AqS3]
MNDWDWPFHKIIAAILSLAIAFAAAAIPAWGQEQPQDDAPETAGDEQPEMAGEPMIEEIIVTARKKAERLTDVPGAVTALTNDRLRDLNINSIDDVARFTPGLSFSKAFGRSTERPVIRGLSNILAGTAPLAESGASYYINGVYFQGDILSLDMNLVERVEVNKGPQSALYGRNAYSGAVNFVLKDLSVDRFRYFVKHGTGLAGEAGDINRSALTVQFPMGGGWGLTMSFGDYDYRGQYRNLNSNQTIGDEKTKSQMLALSGPLANGDLNFMMMTSEDNDGTRALQLQRSDLNNCYPGFRSNVTRNLFRGTSPINQRGTPDPRAGGKFEPDNPYQYYCGEVRTLDYVMLNDAPAEGLPFTGVERDRLIFIAQYSTELPKGITMDVNGSMRREVTSTGSDSDHWDYRYYSPAVNTPAPTTHFPVLGSFFNIAGQDDYVDQSFEIRINSDQSKRVRWGAGAFNYAWERTGSSIAWIYDDIKPATFECVRNRAGECTDTWNVTGATFLGSGKRPDVDEYTIDNDAVFGLIEADINDAATIGFELRLASETKSLIDVALTDDRDGDQFCDGGIYILSCGVKVNKDKAEKFRSTTAKLWYRYRISERATMYMSFANGNKPGGVNNQAAEKQGYPDFEEEESRNVELGVKVAPPDGSFYAALNVFANDITKLQLTTPLADPNGLLASAVSNQGDARITGFEAEIRAFPHPAVEIGLGYTLVNPEITNGCDAFHYILTSGGYLYDADRTDAEAAAMGVRPGATCDISGNQIPLTSKTQYNVDVNFTAAIPNSSTEFVFGLNSSFESSKFAQVHNGLETGDALEHGMHISFLGERYSLRLTGTNITDDKTPVALTRWSDYGQGSLCSFTNFAVFGCGANNRSTAFTEGQNNFIENLDALTTLSSVDYGSPRGTFASLRQGSQWMLTYEYRH